MLRLVAAVVTVVLVVLLGSVGDERSRPAYHDYVAMGDSFTAAPFVPRTDVARGCYRSSSNYPRLLAATLRVERLSDRSCSGAQTRHLPHGQRTTTGSWVPPQLDALTEQTDLVTVGIGANDHRLYAKLATFCRRSTRLCRLHDRRRELRWIVGRLRPRLAATLEQVGDRAPRARVLLVGYPRMLPPRGTCDRLPRMRPQDRATFREVNGRLRTEMRAAAADAGVEFVDFYAASAGHDICSPQPWVQGRQGSRFRAAGMHPLAAGQAALARLIQHTLSEERSG